MFSAVKEEKGSSIDMVFLFLPFLRTLDIIHLSLTNSTIQKSTRAFFQTPLIKSSLSVLTILQNNPKKIQNKLKMKLLQQTGGLTVLLGTTLYFFCKVLSVTGQVKSFEKAWKDNVFFVNETDSLQSCLNYTKFAFDHNYTETQCKFSMLCDNFACENLFNSTNPTAAFCEPLVSGYKDIGCGFFYWFDLVGFFVMIPLLFLVGWFFNVYYKIYSHSTIGTLSPTEKKLLYEVCATLLSTERLSDTLLTDDILIHLKSIVQDTPGFIPPFNTRDTLLTHRVTIKGLVERLPKEIFMGSFFSRGISKAPFVFSGRDSKHTVSLLKNEF